MRKFQGESASLLEGSRGSNSKEVVDFADGLRGFGRSDGPADTPAGDTIGFGHAIDDDGVVAHAVDACHGEVLGAVVENVLVDFVGDAVAVPAQTKITDELEFAARVNLAGGVVGCVENDCLRLRHESSGQFPLVESPIG